MLVLLPPSEGKSAPASGDPVDLAAMAHPELTAARRRVGNALARVSASRGALDRLGVGASLAGDVSQNVTLWENPADVAARVYDGVLYNAAGMASWDRPTLARAGMRVRIVSALWGAISPADVIPAYRLAMTTALPRIGSLGAFWRGVLSASLEAAADGGLVVDCRSASYAAVWRPTGLPWVTVRVEREVGGRRTVVSHMAKHTRGLLTAHLVAVEQVPRTAEDLAGAAAELVGATLIDVALAPRLGGHELTLVVGGA